MSVGRANENTLRIRDDRIAAHHVRIERQDGSFVLQVTADDALTALNGTPLATGERRSLTNGDVISLADLEFRFMSDHRTGVRSRIWVVAGVHRGKIFRIAGSEAVIGRATDNDVQFPDRSVSRHHCKINRNGQAWWIEDLESTNGTLVSGSPMAKAVPINHGDLITTGFSKFVFQEGERPLMNLNLEPLPPCN